MKFDLVRAWKDESYRQGLDQEQRRLLHNPAGEIELEDGELQSIYGGDLGAGAGAFSATDSNCGFGFNNFNRFALSIRCSRNCSFGCDIHQDFD